MSVQLLMQILWIFRFTLWGVWQCNCPFSKPDEGKHSSDVR